MTQGTALVNGYIRGGQSFRSIYSGVLIEAGRFSVLGDTQDVRELATRRGYPVLDLQGRTVVPGFIDTHFHVMATGLDEFGVDLYQCRTVNEVVEKLAAAAAHSAPGEWVLGKRLDEGLLQEGRPPTRQELDRACPGNPVFINDRGLHYVVVNSNGYQTLGIDPAHPGVLTGPDGPNGRLQEGASGVARKRLGALLPAETRRKAVHLALELAARRGTTTIHAMEGGELFDDGDAFLIREMLPDLPLHVVLYWCTDDVEAAHHMGLPRVGGDICLDGSIGSRTAAFSDAYADDPGNRGQILRDGAAVAEMVGRAHRWGMQIGMHAIGELAIEMALTAVERATGGDPGLRHRIEHFGVPTAEHIRRAARLGIVVPTQPAFAFLRGGPGSIYERRLGRNRDRRAYPLRQLVDAGILVAGGSDSDVTPADPLLGLHSCVNHPHQEQRLHPDEALRLFTASGAQAAFEENVRGLIAEGMAADCVVLDRDPLVTDPAQLKETVVLLTISRGEIVFQG